LFHLSATSFLHPSFYINGASVIKPCLVVIHSKSADFFLINEVIKSERPMKLINDSTHFGSIAVEGKTYETENRAIAMFHLTC